MDLTDANITMQSYSRLQSVCVVELLVCQISMRGEGGGLIVLIGSGNADPLCQICPSQIVTLSRDQL